MTHLGSRVSDYVDGQLPAGLTERVTAHLAACPPCREAVERERRVKRALLSMPEPAPGSDFMAALVALGGPAGPVAPRTGHVPGSPRPPLVTFEADLRRDPALSLAPVGGVPRPSRRRRSGALIGAATVMGAGVLSAGLLPTMGGSGPLVRSPVGNIAVTPGVNPLVQQNVRRFGGARSVSTSPSLSTSSTSSAVTPTAVPSTTPLRLPGQAPVQAPWQVSGDRRPAVVASFSAGIR